MNKLENLPYAVKEKINLFALDTVKDYEMMKEFNKIMDYEPCEYSNRNLYYAETRHKRLMGTHQTEQNKFIKESMREYLDIMIFEYIEYMTVMIVINNISKMCINELSTHHFLEICKKHFPTKCVNPFYSGWRYYCEIIKDFYEQNEYIQKSKKYHNISRIRQSNPDFKIKYECWAMDDCGNLIKYPNRTMPILYNLY